MKKTKWEREMLIVKGSCEFSGDCPYEDQNCRSAGMVACCRERIRRIRGQRS